MATGQSFTNAREQEILNNYLRGSSISAPSGLYCGLFGASQWQASHAYSTGNFVVSTNTGNTRLFKCTTAGTSGSSDPFSSTGTESDGSTVADGGVVWTEQTLAMDAIADATTSFISELSGNGYARVNVGQANFGAAAAIGGSSTGSQSKNASAITFAAASGANWKPAVGFFLVTASSAGNYIVFARFSSQVQINVGQQFQFNANGATVITD